VLEAREEKKKKKKKKKGKKNRVRRSKMGDANSPLPASLAVRPRTAVVDCFVGHFSLLVNVSVFVNRCD
jgi:hypothetical protein